MASNAQKTPVARSLERFAAQKATAAIELTGRALPCSVVSVMSSGIVVVKFELRNVPFTLPQITVPMIGSEYIRLPIQVGCKGLVIAADAYLGGMSGLGGGTADLTPRPNLSNLAFVPLGNSAWVPTEDPNAVVIYGPDGSIIRDSAKSIVLTLKTTKAQLDLPLGLPLVINGNVIVNGNLQLSGALQNQTGSTYAGDIVTAGNVIAGSGGVDQVGLKTHSHGGVTTGGGSTGAPTPGS